VINDELRLGA